MATVFLSSSLHLLNSPFQSPHNLVSFRNQFNFPLFQKKCKSKPNIVAFSGNSQLPTSEIGYCKRNLLLFGLSTSVALIFPTHGSNASEEVKMVDYVDDINAYSYSYPMELPSKKRVFKWVESRKPERYSSAAPLSPNARLRIVSERVDIINNLVISVTIGPPNAEFLKSKDKSTWSAKDVADSVLSDKAALSSVNPRRWHSSND